MSSSGRAFRGWWILVAAIVAAGAVAAALVLRESPTVQIVTAEPVRGDMESSASTTGLVVPVNDFIARAANGGTVQQMLVHVGDHVTKGQLLVVMKDPFAETRVANAAATLQSTQVAVDNIGKNGSQEDRIVMGGDVEHIQQDQAAARRNLETMKDLQREGGASDSEVRAAQERVDALNASLQTMHDRMTKRYSPKDVSSWNARLHEAQQSLQAEKQNLANVKIVSPIDGTAYLIPARAYDFLPPGAELLHVADLTHLEIRADFDEPDMGKLHVGEPVRILWEGKADRVWHGHVEHAPLAATHSGTRSVGQSILSVDDAKGDLPPNINVTVTVQADTRKQVISIPREALHIDGPSRFVYRVMHDRLVPTPVETGLVTLDRAEIRSGVAPGDQLALHRLDNQDLAPGMRVEIIH